MHTGQTVQLAGALADIGNHLFQLGTSWAEGALKLALLILIVSKIIQRFSVKAGIGAILGYVIILAIYNSQTELANAFKDEITHVGSAPAAVVRVDDRGPQPLGPVSAQGQGLGGGQA
ncbi:hypothetical protein [Streptomyces noursei]|uniref:Uncharacterized protein n=1 Tax=Streptomyces noursei TaxID=1971 RepID=A0A2N8PQX6_STRNR|nr:hypothetical protein [Streptomyces noursei]PNE43428.1 hypothetical protein AOB60_00355 [Streptomyces noursei]